MSPIIRITFIMIMVVFMQQQNVTGRPSFNGYTMPRMDVPDMNFDDPDYPQDSAYEMRKLNADNTRALMANWPYIRELIAEAETFEVNFNTKLDVPDQPNHIIDYDAADNLPTPIPLPLGNSKSKIIPKGPFKLPNEKKNSNSNNKKDDMHSCHFKICNMGRKRDLRFQQF